MFDGLFGQDDDDIAWEPAAVSTNRGGKAPVGSRSSREVPFIGLSNQYASSNIIWGAWDMKVCEVCGKEVKGGKGED